MYDSWFNIALEYFQCILFGIVVLIIAGGIFCGCFWMADNLFTPHRETTGMVNQVSFYPEHTESYYNVALKMPSTRTVPDQWSVLIVTPEGSDWMDVEAPPNRWFSKGKSVFVEYARGRITNDFRLIKIRKKAI